MPFPTFSFAFFFLIVLTGAWVVRPYPTSRKWFLLLASYFFYSQWDLYMAGLLLGSSLWAYLVTKQMVAASTEQGKKGWLWLAVAGNLGALGVFKYYNFFQESIGDLVGLLGLSSHLPVLSLVVPVGISFYTFQCTAYTIDIYRGHDRPAKNVLDFLLFISIFPQLLIGPICRGRDLLPQLEKPPPDIVPDISRAVSLIASGLFKKVVLATYLGAHLSDNAFISPENYSSWELLIAAYAYTIQVYCDFSGYTDIARGTGLLLGLHIPRNFNGPYRALNIGDFWRRWHISFSNWLRDYIYFPLGGSRGSRPRTYMNLMLTLLFGGLWHGAAWRFILWGFVHGVALVLYKATLDIRRDLGHDLKARGPWWWVFLSWLYTIHLCTFARIFFRSADFEIGMVYWARMLSFSGGGNGIEWLIFVGIGLGLAMNFVGDSIRRAFESVHDAIPWQLRPLFWVSIAWVIFALKPSDVAPYIYFKF